MTPVIRPSSLPALRECPCFVPDQATGVEDKNAGTLRHAALSKYLAEDPKWNDGLSDEDADGVEWAGEYIRARAPMSDYPLEMEKPRTFLGPNFEEIRGTPDIVCGDHIFDLKWRPGVCDYWPQLCAYAVAVGESAGWSTFAVHILHAATKQAELNLISAQGASEVVTKIIESTYGTPKPRACDYCGWCSKRLTCPAVQGEVAKVDPDQHVEAVIDADAMGEMLHRARVVKLWCKSVEERAKKMAYDEGIVPTGFVCKKQRGDREIKDLAAAFASAGLPQADFLSACSVQFGELAERYATFAGLKKAQAERELENRLGETLTRGPEVKMLKTQKG